jgi:alkylation response protein AidB-like acyl-CoA dehydrogenase
MAVLNEEQRMLRESAGSWVMEKSPIEALRNMRDGSVESGFDAAIWNEMVSMGWAGVIIPEQYGGSDFGYFSMGLILEELGRTLTASPLLASGLATVSALLLGGTDIQKGTWLPRIANGAAIGTLAVDEGVHHAPEKVNLRASKSGDGYKLAGTKTCVLEGVAANLLVVSGRTTCQPGDKSGITLFLVPADAPGLTRQRLTMIDSRGAANISFDNVEIGADAILGEVDQGHGLLEKVLDRTCAGISAEMLGAAIQAFEITLDYLKIRVQFGEKIGSFQALQHRAARMFTDLELSRSAVEAALQAIDTDSPEVPELVSLAKVKIGDTFHLISNEMIQMHGGIGMTDAHNAGFYLKRARTCAAAFGNQSYHRDRYARLNGY